MLAPVHSASLHTDCTIIAHPRCSSSLSGICIDDVKNKGITASLCLFKEDVLREIQHNITYKRLVQSWWTDQTLNGSSFISIVLAPL
ncbi:hypothetical protein AXF42_Ash000258 [Apostasia shenzhenica]|uniref:Uncharacterized protein n=1 Tax=Apostasia shenzhenica TaxID=1088818 RepID=A0A2I0AFX8_9ASPA|nr:hypothetical protein AXF42_Ash000258 [Apostasia shenzhenica]